MNSQKKKEIEELKLKYADCNNIIFTQEIQCCMYNYELNNNCCIIGGAGAGKTRGYVIPNILQCCENPYSPSLVITDPKGEILEKTGTYLKQAGYEIRVLNLKEQDKSFCFNPFKYILEKSYEEQISSIVDTIMNANVEEGQKSTDPFWDLSAKLVIQALFYAVYITHEKDEQTIPRVMELFRWFEIEEEDNKDTKLDIFFEILGDKNGTHDLWESLYDVFAELYSNENVAQSVPMDLPITHFKEFDAKAAIEVYSDETSGIDEYKEKLQEVKAYLKQETNEESDDLINKIDDAIDIIEIYKRDRLSNYKDTQMPVPVEIYNKYGDENCNPALRSWVDFRSKCKGKTAQSVTATALAKLAPFDQRQIRRIFSKDELELDLIGERKTALVIVLPPIEKSYAFIANVMYKLLFSQLEYCATVKHNQQLPVPVRFIMDEFYNTGRVPLFDNILSYARSFGIGITIILQSLEQLKTMYKELWPAIIDNCSYFLYLGGVKSPETLKYISELLGKATFEKKSTSESKGKNSSFSSSYDHIGRELMDPAEIQKIKKTHCLLIVSGYNPFYSRKFNLKTHKNYKYTSDASKKNKFIYEYEATFDEEIKSKVPHGEDFEEKNVKTEDENKKPEKITIGQNYEKNLKVLSDNILSMEIVSENNIDEFIESTELMNQISDEEEKAAEDISDIIESFAEQIDFIEIDTSPEKIESLTSQFIQDKENLELIVSGIDEEDIDFFDEISYAVDDFNETVKDIDEYDMSDYPEEMMESI